MRRREPPEAGRSARAEYERRMAEHRASSRKTLPTRIAVIAGASLVIGLIAERLLSPLPWIGWVAGLIVVLTLSEPLLDARKRIKAWRTGSVGEEQTEKWLRKLPAGFVILHDLAIPGSKANVDHLVIGPSGVYVVDSKNYRWKITENRAGELWSGKYPMARIIEAANWEATKVAGHLGGVAVEAMLCVHGAELPRRDLVKNGVRILSPRGVMQALQEGPEILQGPAVERLAQLAGERLGRR